MSLKKIWKMLSISVLVIFTLTGCGGGNTKNGEKEKMVLKLGHVANLEQPYHLAAELFAKNVKERTNGEIEIQVFPNSQLGGQRDLLEGLQLGTVDITLTSSATLGNFIPTAQVIDFPFIFRDLNHVYKVLDGPIADEIYAGAEEKGMKVISTWENGFRNIGNNIRPVKTPDDMKGIKIRVFENQLYIDMFEKLGSLPTPMAMSEVFTALQQGAIDSMENAVVQIYASKFNEVLKYLTLTEHTYNPQTVIFSSDKWSQISPENQKIILEAAAESRDYNRKLAAEKTGEYLKKMEKAGLEVTYLTKEEKSAFKEKMKPVWEKYYGIVGKELVDKIVDVQ